MKKMLKLGLGAAVAGAVVFGGASAASAADAKWIGEDVPTVVSAAPGDTIVVPWTYQNTGAYDEGTGFNVTFNAPEGTKFAPQASVPTQYRTSTDQTFGPNQLELGACTVGAGGLTLTCGQTDSVWSWAPGAQFRFNPTLEVDQAANPGTYSAAAYASFSAKSYSYSTAAISDGTLNVSIEAPAAAPVDITGASVQDNTVTSINGTGEPGSTITVSDANGEIGNAVVDNEGNWTVPSNITESTTVTATDGITEDTYDLNIADVPLIAAPVALGALALGGVGFGGVMLRRRQKVGADA